jgi:transitional endoplasmic reticulum ATPase
MSESTGGFVSADIVSLCQKALLEASKDNTSHCSPVITQTHFESALSISYPSTLQSLHVSKRGKDSMSKSSTSISFATLHGLEEAIELLRVSLIEPLEDCTRFLKFGTVPPKGILLVGPPGSGKSHLAHAVAKVVQEQGIASFVSVQCTDLITKVVGDTEKALRELFETARSAAPCVLYFDQIESIAPVRGFDSSTEQTFDRILSMLLVEMDGFDTSGRNFYNKELSDETKNAFLQQHIVILASTHEKKMLDPAILRPGRFDIHIQLEFPNLEARKRIILDLLKQIPVNFSTSKEWFEGESHEAFAEFLASKTDGVAAGDLHSIMREAAISTMRENIESTAVKIVHIMKALEECRFLKI